MYIDFSVTNQTLSRTSNDKTVENSQNYWRCRFNFVSADWGEVTKAAMFKTPDMEKPVIRLLVDNECDFPNGTSRSTCNIALIGGGSEVITALASGTAAVRSGMIVTTNTVCIPFEDTLDSDDVDCDLSLPDNDFTEFLSKLNAQITKIDNLQEQIKVDLDKKQNNLTFDFEPTADSANPITSGGVEKALDGKADKQTDYGGFVGGENAWADYGVAIGNSAQSDTGAAVGTNAQAWDFGFAGGKNAESHGGGGAAGENARTYKGFAGGKDAKTISSLDESSASSIDAIQLGTGTNINDYTMQVYDYQLLANDATTKSATDGSKYLKDVGKISSLATSVKDNIVNAINSIVTLLSQKVDKVNGKGLSANDYTDEEKEKLINLPAKTELDSDLEGKQDKLVFDSEPTYNSDNSVTSGVIKGALDGKVDKQTDNGGFVGGKDAKSVKQGVAIGYKSETRDSGVAIGALSSSLKHGSAVGYGSYVTGNGGAVGMYAVTGHGFAGGESARTVSSSGMAIDAVQLGNGTNSNEFTMQVYDYQLLADDATTKSSTDGGKYLKDVGKLSSLATSVKDNIVNAVNSLVAAHNDLKMKSVPHKDVSGYPVTLADHLADEEFIKCNVYGSTKGIGNLDSTDGKYKIPVTLTGKNVLPYPYKDPSKTGNGISFTVNGDGSVSLTGTATGKATYYFARSFKLKSGTYTLSEKMKNQSSNVSIILDAYAGGKFLNSYSASAKKTTVITLSQDATVSIYAYVPTGVVCENYPVKPQLEIGTTETEYEPYTANSATAVLDTALGEGEYIDIINKKRYGTDGSTTDITVSGSLKTAYSAKYHISCGTTETPSKIELSYWQDINKVLSETTNAILAQGGDV